MQTVTPHPLMRIRDAAAFGSVSATTIRRRIADGTLNVYRLGPKILRLDPDEVAAAFRIVEPHMHMERQQDDLDTASSDWN